MVKVLSERVEYVAECLATALEIAPSLDEAERAQLAEVLPFATPYWLDSLIASGSSHATADTQLIAQLLQQVQSQAERERGLQEALEYERTAAAQANAQAAAAQAQQQQQQQQAGRGPRPSSPRGQSQQQQRRDANPGSPRGNSARVPQARPPKAQPGARRPSPAPSEGDGPPPHHQAQNPRQPSSKAQRDEEHDGAPPVAWSEFAGDDEGDVVQPADAEEAAEMERRRAERKESRFDSISEELKALNSGQISEPMPAPDIDNREPCPNCGRKFLPDRLKRHVKVCEDMKRGQEWRGTWKSPSAGKGQLVMDSRGGLNTSFKTS